MWEPGQIIPKPLNLPCGGVAHFDKSSGMSHRCTTCFAVVGSMGMPADCRSLFEEHGAKERDLKAITDRHFSDQFPM